MEAHVKGKRFRNRKAEMEGRKQAQRQPMEEVDEEPEDEGDGAAFWVRTVGKAG